MNVTEAFKKLPKTNCGECGEATCIAFALKVQTGQRVISECPYVEGEAGPDAAADTVQDSYEEAGNRLEAQLKDADFKEAALATGTEYKADGDMIIVSMLGRPFEVMRSGLHENGEYCSDSWNRLIIYDFMLRKGGIALNGARVPFEEFPKTPSHVKAFQKRAEADLAKVFEKEPDALRSRLDELGAAGFESSAKADLACSIELLPGIPLYLEFWAADEDFPAGCKLFVDSSVIHKLDIEYIARLVANAVIYLTASGKAPGTL